MMNKTFTYKCPEGIYETEGYFKLGWGIFTHRLWHLFKHGKWMD
tara:strand:- start:257 stop:388 length:132 start_codon:yes stop_codon:yes gene_type:complete